MKRSDQLFALLILALGILSCSPVPEIKKETSGWRNRLDSLLTEEVAAERFSGTVAVGNRDSLLFVFAGGEADRNWHIPIKRGTRFDICSLNKSFIAALVLKAVEERKLELDDKLVDLLAEYSYSGNFHPGITVHSMLNHSSGLPNYEELPDSLKENWLYGYKHLHFSNPEYVNFISKLPAHRAPGEGFYYSNFAYHLLPILLEDVYQKPFPDILAEKVVQPLNLRFTYASVNNQEVHPQLAEAYNPQPDGSWQRNNYIDLSLSRRIFSTSEDLYRWAKALNKPGFLSESSLELMFSNQLGAIDTTVSYGYGWAIHPSHSDYKMGNLGMDQPYSIHGGATEGYRSMLVNVNGGQYILAFLSNVGSNTNEIALARKITHLLTSSTHEN